MEPPISGLLIAVVLIGFVFVLVVALIWKSGITESASPSTAVPIDIPQVLPVDIGIIRIKLLNGVSAAPHIQFKIANYGKANAVLRRVHSKFMMLELPLTKEKADADNVKPGETMVDTWMNSSVLKPGDVVETGVFRIPQNIKIGVHEGRFGIPRLDTPAQLFVFVTIEYDDLSGDFWIGHSCWKYEHPYGVFGRYGGNEWNYQERRR
jgi:hypothetical protein